MKKLILSLAVILALSGYARTREEAERNCQKRLQDFLALLNTSKEVRFLFNASIGIAFERLKAEDPSVTPQAVIQGLANAMRDACMKDERAKEDA